MSKRQQIIDAIKTRFQGILKSGGYNSDIGKNVYDWNLDTVTEDPLEGSLPALNIKDRDAAISIETMGLWNHDLELSLEIFCTNGKETAAEMRLILEDVFAAIGVDDTWGQLAEYTMFEESITQRRSISFLVEQYRKTIARAIVNMKVLYRTDYWKI